MLEKAFELAVVFSAVDRITGPISNMATQLGILDERTKEVQARMNEFRNMTFVGGVITAAGVGLAKIMENGVDTAGQFLSTMTMIKDTTGATAEQMDKIQKTIRDSSGSTIFGIQDTANYAKLLATSGMSGNQINSLLPLFTQYAEVQKLGKGSDPSEAITQAIGAAHTVGAYDPKSLASFLDKYNKATFMQPGSSSEFADTFKYLAPTGASLGMSSNDMLTLSALANRVGLTGSMGGTNAADMILRSIPGLIGGKGKTPSAQLKGLNDLGLNGKIFDKSGNFMGITNFIEQLQKASAGKNPTQLAKDYHDIFGAQGMRLADILSGPRGQDQLKALSEQMGSMKSISQMQEDTNQTPEGQIFQLNTNIQSLKLDVWLQLAKILNPIFMWLNKIVSAVQDFSNAHPEVAKIAAEFLTFATAIALIVGPLLVLVGAIGYLRESGTIATGFKLLGGAFSSALGPIMLLISAGYLLYKAWETDFGGIREKTQAAFEWIQKEVPIVEQHLKSLAKALGFETVKGFQVPKWLETLMGIFVGGKTMNLFGGAISQLATLGKGLTGIDLGKSLLKGGGKLGSGMLTKLFGKTTIDLAKYLKINTSNLFSYLKNALKGVNILQPLKDAFKEMPKLLGDTLKELPNAAKSMLSPLGTVFKTLGNTIKSFALGAINVLKTFFAFLIANPVILVIAAIIAVVVLLYEAWVHNWGGMRDKVQEVIEFVKNKIASIKDTFETVKNEVAKFVTDVGKYWDDLKNFFAHPIQGTINLVKNITGGSTGGSTTILGQNANGTDYWSGGLTWVGEKGPEIVNLPRGSQVIPNNKIGDYLSDDSQQSQGGISFGDINIYTQPGQSPQEIAQMVMKEIGRTMRKQSNSRSTLATQMW